jgi:hypothetical protein
LNSIRFSIIAIIVNFHNPFAFGFAGFCMGYLREVSELQAPATIPKLKLAFSNQKLDLTFWTIGGVLSYFVWF